MKIERELRWINRLDPGWRYGKNDTRSLSLRSKVEQQPENSPTVDLRRLVKSVALVYYIIVPIIKLDMS